MTEERRDKDHLLASLSVVSSFIGDIVSLAVRAAKFTTTDEEVFCV